MKRIELIPVFVLFLCCVSGAQAQVGACCMPDESCIDGFPEQICIALGGEFMGDGTLCSEITCGAGACVIDDYCIEDLNETECLTAGGTWAGAGVGCWEIGACCLIDQTCIDATTNNGCYDLGGIFQDTGTFCATTECEPLGACCISETSECIDNTTYHDCEIDSIYGTGTWQGEGSECSQVNCPTYGYGACCLPWGECWDFIEESECMFELNGTYQGDNVSCSESHCCVWDLTYDDQVNIDDVFALLGVWGPCSYCDEDFNDDGDVNIDDIFIMLGYWGECP